MVQRYSRRSVYALHFLGLALLILAPAAWAVTALEEVIVTAQKRSQSVQDVPIAITTFTGEAMREAGIFNTKDLTDVNPSISFETAQSSQNASLKIRGIGSVGNGRTFEGAVGVFIDGVYRSRSGMALSDMNDIESLELLRGPQGTLFGKNTVAGALALRSTRPSTESVAAQAEILGGSFDKRFVTAAYNQPLNDRHALRISVISNREDGYFESPQQNGRTFNQTDRYGAKAQWLWEISDLWESLLIVDYSMSETGCCWGSSQIISGPLTNTIEYYANLRGLDFYPASRSETDRIQNNNQHSKEIREDMGFSWQLTRETENWTMQSITGYRRFIEQQIDGDADFGPAHFLILDEPSEINFWSQEFNFTTRIGPTDLVFGLYYSDEDFESQRTISSDTDTDNYLNYLATRLANEMATGQNSETAALCRPPEAVAGCAFVPGTFSLAPPPDEPVSVEDYFQTATSSAVYFHTQTELSEKWNVIFGMRYSEDDKQGGYGQVFWYNSEVARALVNTGALGTPPSGDANTPRNGFDLAGLFNSPSFEETVADDQLTSMFSVQYHFDNDVMSYATYSRGYKSGAVNLFNEAFNFRNTTYAPEYAVGTEIGLKSRYWDGRAQTNIALFNTEFTDLQINFFTGINFFTVNAGEAVSRGLEVESTFQMTEELRLELNLTYLDAEFGDLSEAPQDVAHLSDRDAPRAPHFAGVAVANYERMMSDRWQFYSRFSASFTGEHYVGASVQSEPTQESYLLWDVTLGARRLADQAIDVSLFCKNCTDVDYRTVYFATPVQEGSFNAYLNTPRLVGLSMRYRY